MSKVIDKIIEEKIKNEQDKDFYNECKKEFLKSEKLGCDFSNCKCFSDLCQNNNLFFINGLQN